MKKRIKDNDNCTKKAYVPASVKVIELTTQRGICILAGSTGNPWGGNNEEEW